MASDSVTVAVDYSRFKAALDQWIAAAERMPQPKREAMSARFDALSDAGAVWSDVDRTDGGLVTRPSHDFLSLCAEFGVTIRGD